MKIADEFRTIVTAVLHDDPEALDSLVVVGTDAHTLKWMITPGVVSRGEHSHPPRREVICALVARMLRLRWTREARVPARRDLDTFEAVSPHMKSYAEHGDGWIDLVIATIVSIHQKGPGPWHTTQIKEKYGGIRIYYHGDVGDQGDEIIEAAEMVSEHVCEVCGAPGRLRTGGWMMTRCDEHAGGRA